MQGRPVCPRTAAQIHRCAWKFKALGGKVIQTNKTGSCERPAHCDTPMANTAPRCVFALQSSRRRYFLCLSASSPRCSQLNTENLPLFVALRRPLCLRSINSSVLTYNPDPRLFGGVNCGSFLAVTKGGGRLDSTRLNRSRARNKPQHNATDGSSPSQQRGQFAVVPHTLF